MKQHILDPDLVRDACKDLVWSNTTEELEAFRSKWLSSTGLLTKAGVRSQRIEDEWYKKVHQARNEAWAAV